MYEIIGHQPLQGRCPASPFDFIHNLLGQGIGIADHLTLLRLFFSSLFRQRTDQLEGLIALEPRGRVQETAKGQTKAIT